MLPEIQKVNKIHDDIIQLGIRDVGFKQLGNLSNSMTSNDPVTSSQTNAHFYLFNNASQLSQTSMTNSVHLNQSETVLVMLLEATDGGATTSAIHCWLPSIHCAWLHGLVRPHMTYIVLVGR